MLILPSSTLEVGMNQYRFLPKLIITAWIEKNIFRPKKAQFLFPAGKPLKDVTYRTYRRLAGKARLAEIEIHDAVRTEDFSVVEIQEMEIETFPESIFNQNSLGE